MRIYGALFVFLLASCASSPKFNWRDREARLMIDPSGIPSEHYTMIQDALLKSDRFVILKRPSELDAIAREKAQVNPDLQKSRWAEWSKKFDVGGIVSAHVQCFQKKNAEQVCHQYLAIVNAETGGLVAVAEGENDGPVVIGAEYIVPDWEEIAGQLVKEFDKNREKLLLRAPASVSHAEERKE